MATNYDLLSTSGSSSSDSSSDEDLLNPNRKIDLSFHDLDDRGLEQNLRAWIPSQDAEDDDDDDDVAEESSAVADKVEKLLLYNNRLTVCSPAVTSTFANLSVLDLSNNMISSLPEGLSSMTNLVQLFLRNNLIGDNDFPKTLSTLTKLRDLHMSGNRLTAIPQQILEIPNLRNLFLGGNRIEEVPSGIKSLKRLRVLYLGGNRLKSLPADICQLKHLHALILCDNRLESLPECICCLTKLECLQLHHNMLTTIPYGLIHLGSLSELSLRDNPLVVRFVREMTLQPGTLLELSARMVAIHRIPYNDGDLPATLSEYLKCSHECVNPTCKGVYFNTKVEHVKFVDFCGKYRIPLLQYLCSSRCKADRPAVTAENVAAVEDRMKRVLLG